MMTVTCLDLELNLCTPLFILNILLAHFVFTRAAEQVQQNFPDFNLSYKSLLLNIFR